MSQSKSLFVYITNASVLDFSQLLGDQSLDYECIKILIGPLPSWFEKSSARIVLGLAMLYLILNSKYGSYNCYFKWFILTQCSTFSWVLDIFFIVIKYTWHESYSFNHFYMYSSGVLSTLTLLDNYLHHPSLELFHLSKLKLCTH